MRKRSSATPPPRRTTSSWSPRWWNRRPRPLLHRPGASDARPGDLVPQPGRNGRATTNGTDSVTELTNLTIAEARDGLAKKSCSAAELASAHAAAIEKARVLNAFVLET